jgi:uncharacterized protein YbjQ (UPF0145 family)
VIAITRWRKITQPCTIRIANTTQSIEQIVDSSRFTGGKLKGRSNFVIDADNESMLTACEDATDVDDDAVVGDGVNVEPAGQRQPALYISRD